MNLFALATCLAKYFCLAKCLCNFEKISTKNQHQKLLLVANDFTANNLIDTILYGYIPVDIFLNHLLAS